MIVTPYLNAIQRIPGDTASEKLKWFGKLSHNQLKVQKASGDITQVPSELQPLLCVEIAVKKKTHKDVTSALKSEDVTIVRRALQASWFFDGSHKDVVDVEYFREQIFSYVSMNTRQHIIKTLALRLKDPQFAQQMFTKVKSIYGIKQALPLIVVCDEEFIYHTIVNIDLPFAIAKKIFRRNIDLLVRYLRQFEPSVKEELWRGMKYYNAFLPTLVKKRLDTFVELYEIYEKQLPHLKLSNTCADVFLKMGLDHLMRKPHLYIKILPLKKIHVTIIEKIFPGLMHENLEAFDVRDVLKYLEYYPEDKKFDLLCKAYKSAYGVEFLATLKNVTPEVLLLMPVEERFKYARIMIMNELGKTTMTDMTDGENDTMAVMTWVCYLPVMESISSIKRAIYKATTPENRLELLRQMITTCKVNKDEDALIDFMKYFLNRHKNEEDWVFDRVMDKIVFLYDIPHSSKEICTTLNEIIRLFYVKYGWATEAILLGLIHYRFLHNMPIVEQLEMLLETQIKKTYINFKHIFQEHPHCKRQCLVTCTEVVEQKRNAGEWKQKENTLIFYLVEAMYCFNKKYDKEIKELKIARITIKDYPWLERTLYRYVIQTNHYHADSIRVLFHKHEPELYNAWFYEKERRIENVRTGMALKLLKQNLQMILDHWKEYLEDCKKYPYEKCVHRFIRATRWYKDLPIWFMEYCQENWQHKKDCYYLVIMALLLYGNTVTKILEPLIPTETTVSTDNKDARANYTFVSTLPLVMKVSNPPVPLKFVAKLCEGDYLSVALMALTNACRRSSLSKVISLAEDLASKRVSVTKHGIRIMGLVAPIEQLQHFLQSCWQKSKHHSIRLVLLQSIQDLFFNNPNEDNWSMYKYLLSSMTVTDNLLFSKLQPYRMPSQYVVEYIELQFNMINKLLYLGLPIVKVSECINDLLHMITEEVCDNLKDSFTTMLLEEYLFNEHDIFAIISFTVSPYLLKAKGMFSMRMNTFSNIFKKKVEEGWDKNHPKRKSFYPINNTIQSFIYEFVREVTEDTSVTSDVISKMLETFLSVLTPEMEPWSYVLLVCINEWVNSKSPKRFGRQLGARIPDLTKTFSPMFVHFLRNILSDFQPLLKTRDSKELQVLRIKHNVVEGLIESNNMESCFLAADLLLEDIPSRDSRHNALVKRLMSTNHPGVISLLNSGKNKVSYSQTKF